LLLGQTLYTKPEEIYRALVEATAFGALAIINRFEEFGVKIREVINCGGIAEKNPLLMQIYADVTDREMKIARSAQTCALGAAMAGAVVAGADSGGFDNFFDAQAVLCEMKEETFKPIPENNLVYKELYLLYRKLHDAFGTKEWSGSLYNVMKDLLALREKEVK
jgi:L-ribulokinase